MHPDQDTPDDHRGAAPDSEVHDADGSPAPPEIAQEAEADTTAAAEDDDSDG